MSWPLIEIIEEQREEESSMTYGEERARREARMAEMIAATGYERGDSRSPIFGEQIMGIWAGESNPQRVGRYVETRRRTGRLNPGVWYRLTDGRGSFWEYEASQTLFVPVQSTQETLEIPDFLRNQDNLRAERAAQETRVDDGRCICLAGVSDIPEHDEDCPRRQAKAPICSCGTPYGKYCPIHPGDK